MGVKLVWALIEDRDIEIMRSAIGYVIFMETFVDFYLMCCGFVVYLLLLYCPVRQLLCSKGIFLPVCLNQKDLACMGQGFFSFFLL